MSSPLAQFEIKPIIDLELYGFNVSFSNSSLLMLIALSVIVIFLSTAMRNATLVPGRLQAMAEILYNFVESTLIENAGEEAKKYFSIIFSLFTFVLICNLLGMIPYSFTVTSHIIVTFALAMFVFIGVTIIALYNHGLKFFSFFLPTGTPWWLSPIMIVIEVFSYLSRPMSLSIRLAANMIAGHVLLKVIGSFVVMMGLVWGFAPIPFIVIMTGFEFFVAILQAYIFTILTCVYLSDALHLH